MKNIALSRFPIWFCILLSLTVAELRASHSVGSDLTYRCLGGNQYEITLAFYRDCHGVAAPASAIITCSSVSTSQNFNLTLAPIPGTGQEIPTVCSSLQTECAGGTYPGIQEWIYTGITTLTPAADWVFSFDLCCRNAAITTIQNPAGQNIHVESTLDNLNFPCNNSPVFSVVPAPFVCIGQNFAFNNGAVDPDGDFLTYELITPMNGPASTVQYLAPFSATQMVSSNPPVQFDTLMGDLFMFPTLLEVTVMAVKIKQWRNNQLAGTVIRDIQLRTMNCTNTYPTTSGINGTGNFSYSGCAGQPIVFQIQTFDPDPSQVLTLTWNNSIPGATFTTAGSPHPTGTFSWTPTALQAGYHCFTVTVMDNNCPYIGKLTYAICIQVNGLNVQASSTTANCGASNGSVSAVVSGGTPPYSYLWLPCNCNNNPQHGMTAGNYTVVVTDANGCQGTDTVNVQQGAAPGNLIMSATNVTCFGMSDGTATANANGGQPPYSYQWSNGQTGAVVTGLSAGVHTVTVTTAQGCIKTDSVIITEPPALIVTVNSADALCFGQSSGSASVQVSGGVPAYSYAWNSGPSTPNVTGLAAGNYFVTITDASGCSSSQSITINQPAALSAFPQQMTNVSCAGGANGALSIAATGGVAPYNYLWSNGGTSSQISNLTSQIYSVTITDANGCTYSQAFTISQPTALSSQITGTNALCFGAANGMASVQVSGGIPPYSYLWSNGGSTSQISNLISQVYSVTITDANGCTQSHSVSITQPAAITVTTTPDDTICPGNSTIISAFASGGMPPFTYFWQPNVGFGNAQAVNPSASTHYTVIATDANGCTMTGTTHVMVYPNQLNVSLNGPAGICLGQSATLSATVNGANITSYYWSHNLGNGPGPFAVSPTTTTTYSLSVMNNCGFTVTSAVTVQVNPLPQISLIPQSGLGCDQVTLNFSDTIHSNPGATYYWNFGDGSWSAQHQPVHAYSQSGTYTVSVLVTSAAGCTTQAQTTCQVQVTVSPSADFISDPPLETSILQPDFNFTDRSLNATQWQWDFGDGNSSTLQNPSHTYARTGVYTVKLLVMNQGLCIDSIVKRVEVKPEFTFYIPNTFSPNGDDLNEVFTGKGMEILSFEMEIFDRWGNRIFETDDMMSGWDGRANGGSEIAQQDVYVYRIRVMDFEKHPHVYTGHVNLIR